MGTDSKRIVMLMSGIFKSIQKAFCSPPLEAPHCLCIPGYWWFQLQFRVQKEHRTDYLLLLWLSSPALQSERQAMSSRINISPRKFLSHVPQPQAFSIVSESFNMFYLRWLDVKICFPLLLLHYCAFFPPLLYFLTALTCLRTSSAWECNLHFNRHP